MKSVSTGTHDFAEHIYILFLVAGLGKTCKSARMNLHGSIRTYGSVYGKEHIPVRIRNLTIQSPLTAGESTVLSCHYELQGNETLYAVKWYKDMGEFFRYVPGSDPKYKALYQPGVDVDVSKSNHRDVYLRNLGLESLGNYTCQVSTDGPHFRCVQTTQHLDVVVPPSDGPVLLMEPEKSEFELGDNVSILCNSGRGKPAPDLTWYINDRPAYSDPKEREVVKYPDNMESSSLVLRFHLRPDVFKEGKVVLKCVASLHQLEAAATKEIIAGSSLIRSERLFVCFASLASLILSASSQVLPV